MIWRVWVLLKSPDKGYLTQSWNTKKTSSEELASKLRPSEREEYLSKERRMLQVEKILHRKVQRLRAWSNMGEFLEKNLVFISPRL